MDTATQDSTGAPLASGLALAIPLWVLIGGLCVLLVQTDPLSEGQSAVFMAGMAAGAIALRCAFWNRNAGAVASRVLASLAWHALGPTARQGLALAGLTGAYLQYYFVDVSLQIAALPALQVFVPIATVS
jgi:hypothetical protein